MSLICAAQYNGLALDIRRQKLYYTDVISGNVGELSTDGTAHRVLITGNHRPAAVAYDDNNRWSNFVREWRCGLNWFHGFMWKK